MGFIEPSNIPSMIQYGKINEHNHGKTSITMVIFHAKPTMKPPFSIFFWCVSEKLTIACRQHPAPQALGFLRLPQLRAAAGQRHAEAPAQSSLPWAAQRGGPAERKLEQVL